MTVGPLVASVIGLLAGIVLWLLGRPDLAATAWTIVTAIAVPVVLTSLIQGLLEHRLGVDVIALLALVGGLLYHEPLAGALIATMFTTGQSLEAFAQRRARSELSALLSRAPRTVSRYRDGDAVLTPIEEVRPADRLLIKPGEVIPVDGTVAQPVVLDEAALTGESLPVEHRAG